MNADGTGHQMLTDSTVLEATPTCSLDDDSRQPVFYRVAGPGLGNELFLMTSLADGTTRVDQLTDTAGVCELAIVITRRRWTLAMTRLVAQNTTGIWRSFDPETTE
jgi:hypothetical protein